MTAPTAAAPGYRLADVVACLERHYPPTLAEEWDKVGLVAGDPAAEVTKVAFAVDPLTAVVDEALEWGADLLVVHHPLLLRPVSSVAATTYKGALVHRLIRGGCALATAHTNADSATGGVADALASVIGVTKDVRPLAPSPTGGSADGIGRVGELPAAMSLADFAAQVAAAIPACAHGVRFAGDPHGQVRSVAVVGGAGDSLFDAVRAAGVDAYVTADLRHHPASEQREQADFERGGRPYLIDVPHSASEWPWLARVAAAITEDAAKREVAIATHVSSITTDPWTATIAQLA